MRFNRGCVHYIALWKRHPALRYQRQRAPIMAKTEKREPRYIPHQEQLCSSAGSGRARSRSSEVRVPLMRLLFSSIAGGSHLPYHPSSTCDRRLPPVMTVVYQLPTRRIAQLAVEYPVRSGRWENNIVNRAKKALGAYRDFHLRSRARRRKAVQELAEFSAIHHPPHRVNETALPFSRRWACLHLVPGSSPSSPIAPLPFPLQGYKV